MVTIINYDAGNIRNVQKIFSLLGCDSNISSSSDDIINSRALVLPGVGSFKDGMENLKKLDLIKTIRYLVLEKKIPILGICLGMQLFSKVGFEGGKTFGLNLLEMECHPIKINKEKYRVPHIGWNSININSSSKLLKGIHDGSDFYFVHSYAVQTENKSLISSNVRYGCDIISSIEFENIYATQFHPEKSQKYGKKVINNFIKVIEG
tara:strand:- start:160 stop:780 length:621 start_codon:yes stop_codon:yes gene_type:complete